MRILARRRRGRGSTAALEGLAQRELLLMRLVKQRLKAVHLVIVAGDCAPLLLHLRTQPIALALQV